MTVDGRPDAGRDLSAPGLHRRALWWWMTPLWTGLLHGWSLAWPFDVAGARWVTPSDMQWVIGPQPGAPWPWLQYLALAAMVAWWWRCATRWQAALGGWAFASAWLAAVFWWLFTSMHIYGGLPAPLATLAVAALAMFLGLYTGLLAWIFWPLRHAHQALAALFFGFLWTLSEWARGTWLTGFPWGAVGYAHVDTLGWALPWVGVYGVSGLAAALSAALGLTLTCSVQRGGVVLFGGLLVLGLGWTGLGSSTGWTTSTGRASVLLLQGNIAQDEKFHQPTGVDRALSWYGDRLSGRVLDPALPAQTLVVAPETAFPLLPQTMAPEWWLRFLSELKQGEHAALWGLPLGNANQGYANAVWGMTPRVAAQALAGSGEGQVRSPWGLTESDQAGVYRYTKHHLVPFGEFVPPLFRWFVDLMHIPLGDFNRGELGQPPFEWAGQRWAPNICYEDLFGEELARQFRQAEQAPTVLVNVSNLAWFGNSVALDQHLHISRVRAKELERPMVRATNTGATVVIDHHGRVQSAAPRLEQATLHDVVDGRAGLTPYAWWASRWGQWPLVGLSMGGVLGILLWVRRRG